MAKMYSELQARISAYDRLSPALERINTELNITRYRLQHLSGGALPAAAGWVASLSLPAMKFAEAEDAATGLKAAMMRAGGVVGPEFERIAALAERLGNRLPGTTADFQRMMTVLQRQGMSAQSVLGGLGEATAYLGVQLKMPYEGAAEFAAKLQDATKTSERDMLGLADTIQRSYYLGVDPQNMLQGFAKVSPALDIIGQRGLKAANRLAPLLVLADQAAMSGEAAGNAYRKVFTSVMDPKKIAEANQILSRFNVQPLNFTNGKGEFGGLEKMFGQLDKLKKLSTQARIYTLGKVFGDDAETLQVVSLLMDKNLAGYRDVLDRLKDQASLHERVNVQTETLKNLWEATTGTAENGLVAVGATYAPEIKWLTREMGDLSERFQTYAKVNPEVVRAAVAASGAFVGLKVAAWGASAGIGALIAVSKLSPVGVTVRLLTVGGAAVAANWEKVGPVVAGVWDSFESGSSRGILNLPEQYQRVADRVIEITDNMMETVIKDIRGFSLLLPNEMIESTSRALADIDRRRQEIVDRRRSGYSLPKLPESVSGLTEKMGGSYGLNPNLIRAVAWAESRGNPYAVSPKGAMGLMQLMPDTARRWGVRNPFDPEENMRGGSAYLHWLVRHYHGNIPRAVAAYHAGEGNVDRGNIGPQTRAYLSSVMERFQGLENLGTAQPMGGVDAYRNAARPSLITPAHRVEGAVDVNVTFANAPKGMRVEPGEPRGRGLQTSANVGYRSW